MEKKIGIVVGTYPLGVSPMIIHTARMLAASGFQVDIFIDEKTFWASPVKFTESKIRVVMCKSRPRREDNIIGWIIWEIMERLGKRIVFNLYYLFYGDKIKLERYLGIFNPMQYFFSRALMTYISGKSYMALIGIDRGGLLPCSYAAKKLNIPVVYYNMELFQKKNCRDKRDFLCKALEIKCSQKCWFTVIQDRERAQVYMRENKISEDSIRYLAIATCGQPLTKKGDYFRKKFHLSKDQIIVIYAGNIVDWAMCYEIVQSVSDWPENCVLILHTWRKDIEKTGYFKKIVKESDSKRVYFSTIPLEYEELPNALSSADIGLLFYRPIDENFTEIASSSNKIAQYVQVGLPVIASDFPSIRRILQKYKSGVCVSGPDKIGEAVKKVLEDYDFYRRGAFMSYQEHYNFSKAFVPILSEFKKRFAK